MSLKRKHAYHPYQMLTCSTKTIPPGRESKTGECHATDYAFLLCGINLRSESSLILSDLHFA